MLFKKAKSTLRDDSPKVQEILERARNLENHKSYKYLYGYRTIGEGEIMHTLALYARWGYARNFKVSQQDQYDKLILEGYKLGLPVVVAQYGRDLLDDETTYDRGIQLLKNAIAEGNTFAARTLGRYYLTNKKFVDVRGALECYTAIKENNRSSKYDEIIRCGLEAVKDEPYLKELKKGKFGNAYLVSDAIVSEYLKDKDEERSFELNTELDSIVHFLLLHSAQEGDNAEGQFRYANMWLCGLPVAANETNLSQNLSDYAKGEAFKYYAFAAAKNHPIACYNLGLCYEKGIGCEPDLKAAIKMYKESAQLGFELANKKLAKLNAKK